MKLQRLSR